MADQDPTIDNNASAANSADQKQLVLQKIYVKDLSFESPKAPQVFTTNAAPQTQLNIRSSAQEVAPNTHEVTLTLTVEAKDKDNTLFLIELAQSGIFSILGYTADERSMIIGSFCPSTLYPFAREAIADIVTKGGFPPLLLQPINFDALFNQAMRERAARGDSQVAAAPAGSQPN